MTKVYDYSNYREYLRDYYNEMKKKNKNFNYRYFAQKAGINAPATLLYAIEGKRGLTSKSVVQYIKALKLRKREADYFKNLVFYNQARTAKRKSYYLEKLLHKRKISNVFLAEKDKYKFYTEWYYSVIRELVNIYPVKDDFQKLSRLVFPPILKSNAKKAIELLESLGYIEKDENGFYKQTNAVIETGPVKDFAVLKFQRDMLQVGLDSFEKLVKKDKMSSSTTFSISKDTFEKFKEKAREFRKELLEMAAADQNPERVYQLAITLFPVSKAKTRRKA